MLRTIGIRVSPRVVFFTIAEKEENENINILTVDGVNVPKALDIPKQLTFIRTTFISILGEYGVEKAGIRIHEGNSQNISDERLNMEGVIQELLANSTVEKYFRSKMNTLAKHFGTKVAYVKASLDGKESLEGYDIEGWASYKKEEKETILTAIAAVYI